MEISLFENTWNIVPTKSVGYKSVFKTIQSDRFKSQIELIRKLKKEGDAKYKEEKKKLMAVTWSGTFSERAASKITDYSGLLCVDIDDIDESIINELKTKFKNDNHILGGFTSPSGDGLKVLLWSPDCSVKFHQHFYFSAEKYFKDEYNVDIDRACKDVCRLCYVSFDDSAWIRESVESFPVNFNIKPEDHFIRNTYASTGAHIGQNHQRCFKVAKSWVEKIFMFEEGQRNKYIHNLACSLNRLGVPMDVCIELVENNYITPDKKWHQSVGSAYKHGTGEFGSVALKDFDGNSTIPYVEKEFTFGDVERDIRKVVVRLLEKNFPPDVIKNVVETNVLVYRNFFDKHVIEEFGIKGIVDQLILRAQEEFKENEFTGATPIKTGSIADIGEEMEEMLSRVSDFTMGIDGYDDLITGLLCPQNVIGFVGREKTFKSITVQNMAYKNAVNGIPILYCNAEMSAIQFVKRNVKIDSGVDFDYYIERKEPIPRDIYKKAMESLRANTGDRLQVHSDANFNRKGIFDTIKIHRKNGIDIKIVFIDGLSQWEDSKGDEIRSAIFNAGEMKQLAKEANVLVIPLVHMRSGISKSIRDTGEFIRGGNKVTANFDAYFSASLFEIPSADTSKEPEYQKGVFHLLLNDKRGALDVVKKAILVDNKTLRLTVSDKEPSEYEL